MSCGTQDPCPFSCLRVRDCHPLRSAFPDSSTSTPELVAGPTTPIDKSTGLGFSAFARHYSQNTFFSSSYLDVSVRSVPSLSGDKVLPLPGFPIRTSSTLSAAHALSKLFAVYHVLHRHLTPRHPPYALFRFPHVLWRN